MSILSGFLKTKKHRKMADGNYKLQSEWTSASTVEMADGNTAETNLGAIQGITDSLTATSSNIALSAKAGNNLQGQIDDVNSNLNDKMDRTFKHITTIEPGHDYELALKSNIAFQVICIGTESRSATIF